jgi:hypothetical protein
MGIFDLVKNIGGGGGGRWEKCPNCDTDVSLDMERCPKCGVHIKSMFKKKCPKCKTLCEVDAKKCEKCKYNFEEELARAKKTVYVCPICGFQADYYMLRCPSCNARFS